MRGADAVGEVLYGEVELDPEVTEVDGGTATVRDCQDASAAGRKNKDTGKVVTRGGERDLAIVTMKRGSDEAWRVAAIEYRTGDKC